MPLAIETEDGSIIADGDWHRMDDVMRAAHGHGRNRVRGTLIEVDDNLQKVGVALIAMQDKINKTVVSMLAMTEAMGTTPPIEERCWYSELFPSQCAHCLGHVPDWEDAPKVTIYD